MKIISKPSNEIKCGSCLTHFEYDNSDIQHKVEPPGYDEYESRDVYFVACPTCGRQHAVNATKYQQDYVKNKKSLDDD